MSSLVSQYKMLQESSRKRMFVTASWRPKTVSQDAWAVWSQSNLLVPRNFFKLKTEKRNMVSKKWGGKSAVFLFASYLMYPGPWASRCNKHILLRISVPFTFFLRAFGALGPRAVQEVRRFENTSDCRYDSELGSYLKEGGWCKGICCALRSLLFVSREPWGEFCFTHWGVKWHHILSGI